MNLRIDPEFKDYLGALDEDARQTLEKSLHVDGCRDALVVWPQPEGAPILLDGHNRHEICERLGIVYRLVDCPDYVIDRASVVAWIVQNQRGRRNLSPDRLAYLVGKNYQVEKKSAGGDGTNQHTEECSQIGYIPRQRTVEKIAREFGVSPRTVQRYGKYAEAVDAVAVEHGPAAKVEILAGRKKVSDYAPQPEPPAEEEDAPTEPETPSAAPPAVKIAEAAPAPEGKPKPPDFLNMSHSQCIDWMAKNLTPNGDCGAVRKPIPMPEGATENLADPEVAARGDNPFIFALCQMEYHATRAELELKLHPPIPEARPMLAKRLADLSAALETLSHALEEQP